MRYGDSIDTIPHVGQEPEGGGGGGTQGPPGPPGPVGPQGPQGPAGADGADGAQGPAGADGAAGVNGSEGKSAFQVAVDNGFSGTEAQWLESLKASSEVIDSSHTHNIADLSVGDSFYVSDTGTYKIWQGTGFIEFGKASEPLAVDSLEIGDNSFADDPTSGSAGNFKYSDVNGDYLYIHDGTEWHHINGA
jgi:hypothetical protein